MKRPRRNKTILNQLLRIETDLLNRRGLSTDYCSSYISWAHRFGKISQTECDYLCDLVIYSLGRLTVDEEIILLEQVATRPIQ